EMVKERELSQEDLTKIQKAMLSGKTIFQTASDFGIDFELALKIFNNLHKEKWKNIKDTENQETIEEFSLIR
ncbi:MAG: hypothetical protein GXO31_03680, partial [Epsilonproteobacteria bacterium]|nr:hypothetical protein [Campylobacterota bacterium]